MFMVWDCMWEFKCWYFYVIVNLYVYWGGNEVEFFRFFVNILYGVIDNMC